MIVSKLNLLCAIDTLERLDINVDDATKHKYENTGVTESEMRNLVQHFAKCDIVKITFDKSNVGLISDFVKAYTLLPNNTKIYLIGWAGNNRYDLDQGFSHYTCINNNLFFDGIIKEAKSVSECTIADAYYGLKLTRLKAYVLRPKVTKKKKLI